MSIDYSVIIIVRCVIAINKLTDWLVTYTPAENHAHRSVGSKAGVETRTHGRTDTTDRITFSANGLLVQSENDERVEY